MNKHLLYISFQLLGFGTKNFSKFDYLSSKQWPSHVKIL